MPDTNSGNLWSRSGLIAKFQFTTERCLLPQLHGPLPLGVALGLRPEDVRGHLGCENPFLGERPPAAAARSTKVACRRSIVGT